MELFIDAYDWVMVPNLYGMSQYADGGLITTKPYLSGSSYVLKMSNFRKGPWCAIWDALYWRFIARHRDFVLDAASLAAAFQGVDIAYYFVHSMGADRDFEEQDRIAARNFAQAASAAGVRRIVYLGGLGDPGETLSKHLRSRQETGQTLRQYHPQVIEFRASIVIGSGSLSFEMIRALSVEAAAIQRTCALAMPWTFGAWNSTNRLTACGCTPR